MLEGFVKVAACSPELKVADCEYNCDKMIEKAQKMSSKGAKVLAFPELCLTGYTCGDLFLQDRLLNGAMEGLERFATETKACDTLFSVGLPLLHRGRLYNVAAVVFHGEVLGLVPKSHIPTYSEFYEGRHFAGGDSAWQRGTVSEEGCGTHRLPFMDSEVPFGAKQIFTCEQLPELSVAIEICEDLWVPVPPSSYHAMAGATVILNPSASDEVTGKSAYRRELVKNQSARTIAAYLYADASGENPPRIWCMPDII